MTMNRPVDPTVEQYEKRAEAAERSPVPTFLKIGRAIVWVIYAIALVTAIVLTLAFFLQPRRSQPRSRLRGVGVPERRARHGPVPRDLPHPADR